MKLRSSLSNLLVEIICLLFVLLFVYAAISKLLDFEHFRVQLGQSPLLSAFAGWIVWLVPGVELLIALLLLIPKYKKTGIYAAFALMIMFSAYIFIVLHYSSFVPCSCGGILEKMSWNTHLLFNILFVVLAAAAILMHDGTAAKKNPKGTFRTAIIGMSVSVVASIAFMVILFLSSEEIMHHENPFIRRFPNHPAMLAGQQYLRFNSYYFAGFSEGRIYLGNYTNPLHVLSFDAELKNRSTAEVTLETGNIPFKMIRIAVNGSDFYLKDGTVPVVVGGDTKDWKADKEFKGMPYFTHAEMMDSTTVLFRTNNGKNRINTLGIFSADKDPKTIYKKALLQKQIDGVFDTDGLLMYSAQMHKIIYLYYYRNEFIIADKNGKLDYRGHTIDTTSKAKIKVAYLKNHTESTMAAPPLVVNANAAVFGNLLFVHSKIRGKYESDILREQAVILDIYDINKKAYLFSCPVYNIGDQKLSSFIVTATHLYGIIGNELVAYEFKDIIKKEIKNVGLKDN